MESTMENSAGNQSNQGGGMIEVVAVNERVWITIGSQRVGMMPEYAAQLATALRDAATSIRGSGVVVEGEILGAPV